MIGAVANALVALHWSVLQARGEASTVLRLAFMSSFLTFTAFACGLYWGIVGVAAFYAGARWLYVVPSTWITTRGVSFAFWPALRAGGDMLRPRSLRPRLALRPGYCYSSWTFPRRSG